MADRNRQPDENTRRSRRKRSGTEIALITCGVIVFAPLAALVIFVAVCSFTHGWGLHVQEDPVTQPEATPDATNP